MKGFSRLPQIRSAVSHTCLRATTTSSSYLLGLPIFFALLPRLRPDSSRTADFLW